MLSWFVPLLSFLSYRLCSVSWCAVLCGAAWCDSSLEETWGLPENAFLQTGGDWSRSCQSRWPHDGHAWPLAEERHSNQASPGWCSEENYQDMLTSSSIHAIKMHYIISEKLIPTCLHCFVFVLAIFRTLYTCLCYTLLTKVICMLLSINDFVWWWAVYTAWQRSFDSLIPKRFDCSVFLMLLIKMLLTFVIDECEMFAAALMSLLADHTNRKD